MSAMEQESVIAYIAGVTAQPATNMRPTNAAAALVVGVDAL
ncbi:MAG: hypothetical protein ACSLFB_14110 [Acidimicrobiales bacterium]